ncbi:SDR family NAD(P)-dependent oxidoreductase [Ramlibacter sp.]|uniref:SDR family NAD(P)-dependent oxidoreductase n=1 Tax=Ramlibacter sp. TaxID=1917967 RepID=UPI003D0C0A0F
MAANPPRADWTGARIWIVGASSGIGRATAEALVARGASVYVSARNARSLAEIAASHPAAVPMPLDATSAADVQGAARDILAGGPLDMVVYCAGHYSPMRATAFDLAQAQRHLAVNYEGALLLLDAVLKPLLAQRSGHIALVSSVAGYRGLPNSLAYGPTKAALINLAQTLSIDLQDSGVGVSVVNPGFVETPLTAGNDFRMPALITPREAAEAMIRGWERGDFEIHFPRRFTWTLKLMSLLPFGLYRWAVRRATGL